MLTNSNPEVDRACVALFDISQLNIFEFNRIILYKDLFSPEELLQKLKRYFRIKECAQFEDPKKRYNLTTHP